MFEIWKIHKYIFRNTTTLFNLEQQERVLPNVKDPTATSISTLYRLLFFLHWKKNSSIINKYYKHLNVKLISLRSNLALFYSYRFCSRASFSFLNISVILKVVGMCGISCFKILDHANAYSQLKLKDNFHIEQLKPELNKQVE